MKKKIKTDLDIYMQSLSKLHEDDLSKFIIKPLFEAMGYVRVDFYGGSHERGKDIIALRKLPPKKEYHVSVIQTKKVGTSQKSPDVPVIRKLISQLQQCFTDDFPIINRERVKPDEVYLVCPEKLTSRLLDEINGQLNIIGKKVTPFDGPRIIELIKEYKPGLLECLLSFEDKLLFKQEDQLHNIELFSALNRKNNFDFVNCYSDLNFFVGSVDSNVLLSAKITVKNELSTLDSAKWQLLKDLMISLEHKLNFNPLSKSIAALEHEYLKEMKSYQSDKNKKIYKRLTDLKNKIKLLYEELKGVTDSIKAIFIKDEVNGVKKDDQSISDIYTKEIHDYIERVTYYFDEGDFNAKQDSQIDYALLEDGVSLIKTLINSDESENELSLLISLRSSLISLSSLNKNKNKKNSEKYRKIISKVQEDENEFRKYVFNNSNKNNKNKHTKKFKNTLIFIANLIGEFDDNRTTQGCNVFIDSTHINNVTLQIFDYTCREKILNELISLINIFKTIMEQNVIIVKLINEYVSVPCYEVAFDHIKLEKWLKLSGDKYKNALNKINRNDTSFQQLKIFLDNTENTLNVIFLLKSKNNPLKNKINIDYSGSVSLDGLDLSPHLIFDTGINVAVYGGAGVGKTTTLQMYAKKFNNSKEFLIYLPLNRLLDKYEEVYKRINEDINEKKIDEWGEDNKVGYMFSHKEINDVNVISHLILINMGIECTSENLSKLEATLENNPTFKLILDGLDEAYDSIPSILDAIRHFKKKHTCSQLIISSRDCVSYLGDIDFLGITLLPFTEEKLYRFINGWFENSEKSEKIIKQIIDKKLYDIIRTPLLATLMCSLVEQGVNIPSSESAIYSKRLSLLCGDYDIHKRIERQTVPSDVLKLIAKKIAYELHSNSIRSSSFEFLVNEIVNNPNVTFEKELCIKAVEELINPCNLLIKDTLTANLSFGHFRFQEHLVSLEINENRSLDLIPLLSLEFWRGTFILYAQTNDIAYLIDEHFNKQRSFHQSETTLREMFKVRPKGERLYLENLLEENLKADYMDEIFSDPYYHDDGDVFNDINDFNKYSE